MTVEYAPRGLVGVLTPQANTTVEPEFAVLWPAGVAMLNARLTSARPTVEERLVDYFDRLDEALPQFANAPLDALALACTGTSYLVGRERETATLARVSARLGIPVVTAGTAVVDAFRALGARRIGLVSPYPQALTDASVAYWTDCGLEVAAVAGTSLDWSAFHPIYSIPASGARAALDAMPAEGLDAVVMMGTGMPTLAPILDKPFVGRAPVLSCMLALAWRTVDALDGREPSADTLLSFVRAEDWRRRFEDRRWPRP